MSYFTTFDNVSGKYLRTLFTNETDPSQDLETNEIYVNGEYDEKYHIVDVNANPLVAELLLDFGTNNTLSSNTAIADNVATITYGSSLPNPTYVKIISLTNESSAAEYIITVTDGELVLSSPLKTELTIILSNNDYFDKKLEVEFT